MGAAGETGTPPSATSKSPKATSATTTTAAATTTTSAAAGTPVQDPQAGAPGYNEWLAAFQAYYQAGAQPPAGGGFPHPYMWGGQPMMPPPYGGPHPSYGAMYPPGGMYGHPMYGQYGTVAPEAMGGGELADGKPEVKTEGAKPNSLKRSKGSKGSLQLLKVGEGKGNGVSQSSNGEENDGETGSDGSTDGSGEGNAQNLLGGKRSFEQMAIEAVGGGPYMPPPGGVVGAPPPVGAPGSGSLDMSLDYWSAGSVPQPKGGKRASGSPSTSAPPAELWLTDEREVKRQRRKQSNRESARRSRLRKQAECEELGTRVDTLTVENMALRTELSRVTEECKRLQDENRNLVQKIHSTPAQEVAGPVAAAESPGGAQGGAGADSEAVVSNRDMEESQGNANGNVKTKVEKPAVNGDADIKAQDEQGAAA
ncbi:hypothetical protein M758_8G164100 [Ceratodon purpureus]|nr:hypothetical protein M758_8G164100 [Ceratodon purpureus]